MPNEKRFSGETVIFIDDDREMRELVAAYLEAFGVRALEFSSSAKVIPLLKQGQISADVTLENVSAIICDIQMPDITGLEFVRAVKSMNVDIPVLLMTAFTSVETAIEALRAGAFDYIRKPLDAKDLELGLARAFKFRHIQRENVSLRQEVKKNWSFSSIIGKSVEIKNLFEVIKKVAPTNANVLIQGESGTGKELVAKAIHSASLRADKPFVALNCAAIPEALLESELFGHVKGAFTGAVANRKGQFEEADEGTLFLDEIGDLELTLQAKLLRVLQDRKIRAVGENKMRSIDVRIVSATHKDLKAMVKEGKFREDLYYRLNVIPVDIPPLRERVEDIPVLAEHFLKKAAALHGLSVKGFHKDALAAICRFPWRGNVRELENFVERSAILASGDWIDLRDVTVAEESARGLLLHGSDSSKCAEKDSLNFESDDGIVPLEEVEARYLKHVMSKFKGTKEELAKLLGIDRKTLYRKEKEFMSAPPSNSGADEEHHSSRPTADA